MTSKATKKDLCAIEEQLEQWLSVREELTDNDLVHRAFAYMALANVSLMAARMLEGAEG